MSLKDLEHHANRVIQRVDALDRKLDPYLGYLERSRFTPIWLSVAAILLVAVGFKFGQWVG